MNELFSLETRQHMLGWSAGLAFVINNIIGFKGSRALLNCVDTNSCSVNFAVYWPFRSSLFSFIFWFLLMFGILYLVKYYKSKKQIV